MSNPNAAIQMARSVNTRLERRGILPPTWEHVRCVHGQFQRGRGPAILRERQVWSVTFGWTLEAMLPGSKSGGQPITRRAIKPRS